jgi:Ca-activated chloride channel homolog
MTPDLYDDGLSFVRKRERGRSPCETLLCRSQVQTPAVSCLHEEELTDYLLNLTEESFEEMKEEIERKYRGE